ncbi:hypothetical protein [Exercitatus varius]|uniref:hypothetical protein n=1 Tax=Exercitatus varius TaxID=67857 RepID=UPI00294B752F|nr:hypothetical protein [Exercitatus varius]MDG2961738.1 hypothetical protein [Exercitatus varius]
MPTNESPILPLTYALCFAIHFAKTENLSSQNTPVDKIKTLFDYAEWIQEEYEKRIKEKS